MQVFGKLQHRSFPVKFAKCLRAPILKNICKQLLPYLHNNSHCHYHHHHFHYHCKMHLYHLSILLPIPVDCNIIQSVSVKFLSSIIFLSNAIPSFLFFMPSKRTQNSFMTSRQIFDALFIPIFRTLNFTEAQVHLNPNFKKARYTPVLNRPSPLLLKWRFLYFLNL